MRVSHAYLSAALSPLVVRTTGSGDCNRESAASFDSSRHPLSFWVARVCQFVPLCRCLVVRATGSSDCNCEFAALFDSSRRPFSL
jgi:hypothetical protein